MSDVDGFKEFSEKCDKNDEGKCGLAVVGQPEECLKEMCPRWAVKVLPKGPAALKPECNECWYFTHSVTYPKYKCNVKGECPAFDKWDYVEEQG